MMTRFSNTIEKVLNLISTFYENGTCTPQDYKKVFGYYSLAAEKFLEKRWLVLTFVLSKGITDGNPDLEEDFDWYLKFANVSGYGFSQWIIGN